MYDLEVGPLHLNLHRTVRVKICNEAANLPPSLGLFEIFKVSDYPHCPEHWEKDAYFIAINENEAVWLSFQALTPVAILVSAGGVNAVTGEHFKEILEEKSYLVSPPQPWLDGWKGQDNEIYQFVSAETGEGRTISEQLNTNSQALIISVFKPKDISLVQQYVPRPHQKWCDSDYGKEYCCAAAAPSICREVGLGKGGRIQQKIYEDPHGLDVWNKEADKTVKIYLINASAFSEITGKEIPPAVSAEQYNGKWWGLQDEALSSVKSEDKLEKLKNAF